MGLATIDSHGRKEQRESLVLIGLVLTEIQAFKNVKYLQRNVWKTGQIRTNVIAIWTSPLIPGVSCECKYFFTTGRWGTSPCWGPRLPCEQALTYRLCEYANYSTRFSLPLSLLVLHAGVPSVSAKKWKKNIAFSRSLFSWSGMICSSAQHYMDRNNDTFNINRQDLCKRMVHTIVILC